MHCSQNSTFGPTDLFFFRELSGGRGVDIHILLMLYCIDMEYADKTSLDFITERPEQPPEHRSKY